MRAYEARPVSKRKRDGSIAEKSQRSGADFLTKKSSQSRRPDQYDDNQETDTFEYPFFFVACKKSIVVKVISRY